ncbi:paralemmin-3 [Perognathus longimembris pacificus]|uniref:paralemmin-3 n=1 Tax=Perognathus longimembris pacificus TaxID=214514 RepID=UPI0020186A40|nr:paralemmin-3 [Perognathus longimembris pacificus]
MALQSQAWAPATPMPMAESSLYRQRLEVIAEKRRLQEDIRAAHRELEEERLRAQRLKRKSLRERWLMDGAAEALEDPTSKDAPSPEVQAQTRIRNLEDSLFTLQSQLQLLQSASTGAQHKPAGRPAWRRQGHRPLSHPAVEASPAGHTDLDKRASLPARLVAMSPRSPPEPREEAPEAQPSPRPAPGTEGSSESNGPYCGPSTAQEQELGPWADAKRGDMVEVVWAGLRPTEDSARAPTGCELEAKVEEAVLEAIGDRQAAGSPLLPAWVREDSAVVEVVWEGLGGRDVEATGIETTECRDVAGVPGGSPGGPGPGDPAGEAGSFIWVERLTLGEDWELIMEGLEGPTALPGAGGGLEAWEAEGRRAEEAAGVEEAEQEPGKGRAGVEEEAEGPLVAEEKRGEGSLDGERKGGKESLDGERKSEGPPDGESQGSEGPTDGERKGEDPPDGESQGSEVPLSGEKTTEVGEEPSSGELGERAAPWAEEASAQPEEEGSVQPEEEGSAQPEMPEEPGLRPGVGSEGFPEEELGKSEGPQGDAAPLLVEALAPQLPTESQPLLQREGPSANPSAHPAPTYAPAQQPVPTVPTEGEKANSPKQKTCQCCAVM